jgi:hypothetical protein
MESKIKRWREQGKLDAPKVGYIRWTCYVEEELLAKFKEVAAMEGKSLVQAINEALDNWTYFEVEEPKTK